MVGTLSWLLACGSDVQPQPDPARASGSGGDAGAGGSTSSSSSGGAGGAADVGLGHESGTRLKVRYYEADDGARQPIGWFDNERREACSFMLAAGGTIRCLPADSIGTSGYFADVGCSVPAITVANACSSPPAYGFTYELGACGKSVVHVHPVESEAFQLYTGTPGNCTSIGDPPTLKAYQLGAEMNPGDFVAATEQVEP